MFSLSVARSRKCGLASNCLERFQNTTKPLLIPGVKPGGTVEVQWLQAVWGALDLRTVGTAALDDELRPLAAMTADIRGFAEALQALAAAGVISTATARTGSMALGLIAKPSSDGSPSVLTVPLTAQDGGLYLGPVRLTRLPTLFR